MTKPKKVQARIGKNEYLPHETGENSNRDYIHVRQGDEHVRLILMHPSEHALVESHPRYNGDTVWGNSVTDKTQTQHTLWDRPHGSAEKPEITGLFATPGAKSLVGTAIGLAVEHSHKRFGQTPTGSRDLSENSLPMVERLNKRLEAKGFEKSPTPWRPTNELTQDEENAVLTKAHGEKAFKDRWYKSVPDKDIHSANHLIRGLYAGRNLNRQQFHQDELPFGDK